MRTKTIKVTTQYRFFFCRLDEFRLQTDGDDLWFSTTKSDNSALVKVDGEVFSREWIETALDEFQKNNEQHLVLDFRGKEFKSY